MRRAGRRPLPPKNSKPVSVGSPAGRFVFHVKHFVTISCDIRTNVSRETSRCRKDRARAVAHMTLPCASTPHRESARAQHHGQTHVLQVSIGIIGDVARLGGLGRGRGALGDERRDGLRRPRGEGAQRGGDSQLKAPTLINDDMSLRRMHGDTLPQWSAPRSEKVARFSCQSPIVRQRSTIARRIAENPCERMFHVKHFAAGAKPRAI